MTQRIGERPLTVAERKQRYRERLRGGAPPNGFADAARLRQQRRRQIEAAERGPLFRRMAAEAIGDLALDDLTVLAAANDPYRLDTPARRRDGQWLADQISLLVPHGTVHLRGLHYRLVAAGDVRKPNGAIYRNTDADWTWLGEDAAKAARWLGFVPFDRIVDEKNEPPEVFTPEDFAREAGQPFLVYGFAVELPNPDGLMPSFYCHAGTARQPCRVIFVGEKSSLRPILAPFASQVGGELILPSGELSDTLIKDMAHRAADDDRPAVVLYFSDFDPSGFNMPIVVSRKLQALRDLQYPELTIEVHPVALAYDQVVAHDLPSTPLKETELRSAGWRERHGREQTEIDALAALQPEILRDIVRDAVAPFYDPTLQRRVREAAEGWQREANEALQADPEYAACEAALREAYQDLADAAEALEAVRDETRRKLDRPTRRRDFPTVEITAESPEPLYSSKDNWLAATRRLKRHRGD